MFYVFVLALLVVWDYGDLQNNNGNNNYMQLFLCHKPTDCDDWASPSPSPHKSLNLKAGVYEALRDTTERYFISALPLSFWAPL